MAIGLVMRVCRHCRVLVGAGVGGERSLENAHDHHPLHLVPGISVVFALLRDNDRLPKFSPWFMCTAGVQAYLQSILTC